MRGLRINAAGAVIVSLRTLTAFAALLATVVSGRLGEWIEVGAIVQSIANQQTTLLGSTRELASDNRRILLKVDEIR